MSSLHRDDRSARAGACTVSFGDGEAVVQLAGELDLATASHLTESATPLAGAWATVVLDLGELTFCDSSGVRALLLLRRCCERAGTNVVLRSPTPLVRRVLALARADEVFRVELCRFVAYQIEGSEQAMTRA